MRHRRHFRRLNRTSEHRLALRRNLAQSFVEHGQITTTLPKAKSVRPFLERLITMAVQARRMADADDTAGALGMRRSIHKMLNDRALVPAEHKAAYNQMSDAARAHTMRMASGRRFRSGQPKGRLDFTAESVTHRLIETVAPRFRGRAGGYTRLIRLADVRVGDASPLATIQSVGDEIAPVSLTKPRKSARKRRADSRYALAVKVAKGRATPKERAARAAEPPAAEAGSETT